MHFIFWKIVSILFHLNLDSFVLQWMLLINYMYNVIVLHSICTLSIQVHLHVIWHVYWNIIECFVEKHCTLDSWTHFGLIIHVYLTELDFVNFGSTKWATLLCDQIRVWKEESWSRNPAPFSQESRIPHFFHHFPESRFSFWEKIH